MQIHHRQRLPGGRVHNRLRPPSLLQYRLRREMGGHPSGPAPGGHLVPEPEHGCGRVSMSQLADDGQESAHVGQFGS